jgi:hypothetical protein
MRGQSDSLNVAVAGAGDAHGVDDDLRAAGAVGGIDQASPFHVFTGIFEAEIADAQRPGLAAAAAAEQERIAVGASAALHVNRAAVLGGGDDV